MPRLEQNRQPIGSMHYLTQNPGTGRQRSIRTEILDGNTLGDLAARGNSGHVQTRNEKLGKRISSIDGEETDYAHFEIIKKNLKLAECGDFGILHELAANGIAATREEILAIRRLGKDEVYVLERGALTFVVERGLDGRLCLFSANVYIPFVRNCQQFGGQDVFLNIDNTPAVAEFDGAILRIRAVYNRNDFPNSTFEPLQGVFHNFGLFKLNAGEACPAEVAREIFRGISQMQQASLETEAAGRMLWLMAMQNASRQRRALVFDGVRVGFSSHFEETRAGRGQAEAENGENAWHGVEAQVALPESIQWLDAPAGRQAMAQESVPAMLARVPVLLESLADLQAPAQAMVKAEKYEAAKAPGSAPAQQISGMPLAAPADETPAKRVKAGAAVGAAGAGRLGTECTPCEAKDESRKQDSHDEGVSPQQGRGRGGRRARKFKPVPFSALSSFKAVIFDLDGVIVDSEMVHPRTFERALSKYGIRIENSHWKRAYTGIGSYAIFDDIVKKHKIKEDAQTLVEKRNEIYLAEIKRNKLPVIEGFPEVHRLLAGNGVKEAVASGGHANHVEESLRSAGLRHVPFVSIEMVKRGKPAPEIFLKAAKRLRVKPSECIVFEDSLSGTEAAARAGMPCVALSTTMPHEELHARAALVVRNFRSKKLARLLEILLARRKPAAGKKSSKALPRQLSGRKRK